MAHVNGRTGPPDKNNIVSRYEEEIIDDNYCKKIINLCDQNSLKKTNGFFLHQNIYKFNWTRTTDELKSIIA